MISIFNNWFIVQVIVLVIRKLDRSNNQHFTKLELLYNFILMNYAYLDFRVKKLNFARFPRNSNILERRQILF